jgi:aspartate aminotransferase-like enzyme
MSWADFDTALRNRGLVVGGSYGQLAGKVFRLGHMGSQAEKKLVRRALDVIAETLKDNVR